jgi:hypothetical protein
MYDEGSQTTSPDYGNIAKAAQPSPLAQLIDTQEKTKHLLSVLGEKCRTSQRLAVVFPEFVEAADRLTGGYHIQSALSQQHEINDAISYLIETVVI